MSDSKRLPEYAGLEDLKKDFTISELVEIAKEQNLAEWLASNFYLGAGQKLLDVVENGGSDDEIFAILCRIFNWKISDLSEDEISKIMHSLDKIRLRLNNKAAVAETQSELAAAVWSGADTICLLGEELFYIPLGTTNKKFIGEGNTLIEIFYDDDVDLDAKNLVIENAQIFRRTPNNLKMDNSTNVKVIDGFKKTLASDDLREVLNVMQGRSPFESIEQYRQRAENCKGVAVGYVTLKRNDFNFDEQTFSIEPTWDLKYMPCLKNFVVGKKFTLKIAPDVAQRLYFNERRLQIFADLTFADKLTVASLYLETASAGRIFIENWN